MTFRHLSAAALALALAAPAAFAGQDKAVQADATVNPATQGQAAEALPTTSGDEAVRDDDAGGASDVVLDDPDNAAEELQGAMSPTGTVEADPDVEEIIKKRDLVEAADPEDINLEGEEASAAGDDAGTPTTEAAD